MEGECGCAWWTGAGHVLWVTRPLRRSESGYSIPEQIPGSEGRSRFRVQSHTGPVPVPGTLIW